MNRYLLILFSLLFIACNDNAPVESGKSAESSSPKLLPELQTGTKTSFKQIEKLPPGIETIFNKMPLKENGFYKFSFPRYDLNVMSGDVKIDARFALTSWLAFMPQDSSITSGIMMGDLVLLETELQNVLKKLDEKGIDITAIHNHFTGEKPKIIYLHVSTMGNPMDLFERMKEILEVTGTPLKENLPDTSQIVNWDKVENILVYKGKKEGTVLKFSVARKERIKDAGVEIPENFGISSDINFEKYGDKTAVSGDLVLIPSEVNTVQKMLTRGNILVTALHNHMLFEQPRVFFMHFFSVGDAEKISMVIKDVLNSTNHERRDDK